MPTPDDAPNVANPDYWQFAQAAATRISQEFPECDVTANRLFVTLFRASSSVIYDFESSIHRPAGGTWASYRMLFALWVAGPLTPHRAAELMGMSRAAVSNLAGNLESKGLLVKQASEEDGRSLILHLTDSGQTKIQEVFARQNSRENDWSQALTEQERELLISLLDKIMDHRTAIGAKTRK